MIHDHLQKIARNHKINSQSPVFVLVLTEVTAFNIHGIIIHLALSIPISRNNHNLDLNSERLKILQKKLNDIEYLVIDEKSMVE